MNFDRPEQWIALDEFRRKSCIKYELKRKLLKFIMHNTHTPLIHKYKANFHNSVLP
jgi:hypothetical protein